MRTDGSAQRAVRSRNPGKRLKSAPDFASAPSGYRTTSWRNDLSASSLRKQGPIATDVSLAKIASSIALYRGHNAVWVPDRRSLALTSPGRRGGEFSDSIVIQREGVRPHSRGAMRPSFASIFTPRKQEGAGKAGCALHPRSRVQNAQTKTHTSIQVQRRQSGLPCAMVLRLISRSPR